MIDIIKTSESLDQLLNTLDKPVRGKGSVSAYAHLNSALKEWRVEGNWGRDNAFVIGIEGQGYAFFMLTKREPRHCTLRHIFTIESARGTGVGEKLINEMRNIMQDNGVSTLRFFANKTAISWYEKLGYKWHGLSKTGLPFFYGDKYGNLIDLPRPQRKYVISAIPTRE